MAMYDDQVTYFRGLIDFIVDVDHWSASRRGADQSLPGRRGL
jgi:hypothetical protein